MHLDALQDYRHWDDGPGLAVGKAGQLLAHTLDETLVERGESVRRPGLDRRDAGGLERDPFLPGFEVRDHLRVVSTCA
ncbi:hypothetical protein [Streptomyces sp. NPDC057557]|uniref:hypothetical protein n=1 Tax=Streptomyces sp. NPDC057557 TaxID=3346167 RepID=UPI0036836C8D